MLVRRDEMAVRILRAGGDDRPGHVVHRVDVYAAHTRPRLAHSSNNTAQHWWQADLALFNLAHSRAQRFGSKYLKVRA
jgi:hypothetical protein